MPHTLAAALRHLARSIAVVALGVLVLGVATLGQVPAPVGLAAMAAGDPVTFTGHGYGRGRGMGQHGAYGYARSGWSWSGWKFDGHTHRGRTSPRRTALARHQLLLILQHRPVLDELIHSPPATVPHSPSCCQGYIHRQRAAAESQITAVWGW